MTKPPPGRWEGSDVTRDDLDWLRSTRRITPEVICRKPGKELVPTPEPGERVVFLTHFERGFGLPASDFFRDFLDTFGLQPHHLPANAFASLSGFVSFCEGYLGLLPTVETWAKYFYLRKHTIPGSKPKELQACGSVSITPRPGSIFPRIQGLDTVKKWQRSFLYVKSLEGHDALNLPEFRIEPPTGEFKYDPDDTEELRLIHETLDAYVQNNLDSDDLVRTFICRRVNPLQHRAHKICHMSPSCLDPTRISKHDLDRLSVKRRVNAIVYTEMSDKWHWGVEPFHRDALPPQVCSPLSESLYFLIETFMSKPGLPLLQLFDRQAIEDGDLETREWAPDRSPLRKDDKDADTDDYLPIPRAKPVRKGKQPGHTPTYNISDDEGDDCRILDPIDAVPISWLPPVKKDTQGSSRKRAETSESDAPPAKRVKKSGAKPSRIKPMPTAKG